MDPCASASPGASAATGSGSALAGQCTASWCQPVGESAGEEAWQALRIVVVTAGRWPGACSPGFACASAGERGLGAVRVARPLGGVGHEHAGSRVDGVLASGATARTGAGCESHAANGVADSQRGGHRSRGAQEYESEQIGELREHLLDDRWPLGRAQFVRAERREPGCRPRCGQACEELSGASKTSAGDRAEMLPAVAWRVGRSGPCRSATVASVVTFDGGKCRAARTLPGSA